MKKKYAGRQVGFTLIELIVGVAVLAILTVVIMLALNPFEQFKKAADAKRKSDLSQLQKSFEAYYQDKGRYPNSTADYYIASDDPGDSDGKVLWGDPWTPYMAVLPKDSGGKRYIYVSTGQTYYLYASLDRGVKDPQVCNTDGTKCTNAPADHTCGTNNSPSLVCNYGVSSANVSP